MAMIAYGSELAERFSNPVMRAGVRMLGSYDLGARVRFAAVNDALRALPAPIVYSTSDPGLGLLSFAMHRVWPSATIVGTDIDPARLQSARETARRQKVDDRVTFAHVDEHHAVSEYDVVTCVDVLEHVEDDEAFVAALFAATRPGGRLVLHVPAAVKKRYLSQFPEQADHVRPGYSADALVALLRRVGFTETRVRYTFGPLGALGWEGCELARQGRLTARLMLPFWYACAIADSLHAPMQGNGVLAVARKPA